MLTSLSFIANIIALACSAAFPTIGSKITLINETGIFHATDAPCIRKWEYIKETRSVHGVYKEKNNNNNNEIKEKKTTIQQPAIGPPEGHNKYINSKYDREPSWHTI